jgi:hypothetical protein
VIILNRSAEPRAKKKLSVWIPQLRRDSIEGLRSDIKKFERENLTSEIKKAKQRASAAAVTIYEMPLIAIAPAFLEGFRKYFSTNTDGKLIIPTLLIAVAVFKERGYFKLIQQNITLLNKIICKDIEVAEIKNEGSNYLAHTFNMAFGRLKVVIRNHYGAEEKIA